MSHFDDSGPSTSKKAKYSDDIGSGTETIDLPACPYGERYGSKRTVHVHKFSIQVYRCIYSLGLYCVLASMH